MGPKTTLTEEEIAFSEIIGDLVEQWGFNRNLGRVWSILYLRKEPLSPSHIQDLLSLSAGSVSSSLAELQMWGVLKRIRMAGDRNFYYEPETHIWKSVSNVLRMRELRILEEAEAGLAALVTKLSSKGKSEDADFQVKRVKHIRETAEMAHTLFDLLNHGGPLALTKLVKSFDKLRSM